MHLQDNFFWGFHKNHECQIPLIDGRGKIWSPYSSGPADIMHYTLNHQVQKTFDFTSSVTVALKEYAPDNLLLLGPGNSLGGSGYLK